MLVMTNSSDAQLHKADQRYQNDPVGALRRNRRLEYLRRVLRQTDYFSASEMQLRRPDLYHSYFTAVPIPEMMVFAPARDGDAAAADSRGLALAAALMVPFTIAWAGW